MNNATLIATTNITRTSHTPWPARYLLWPLLFAGSMGANLYAITHHWSYSKVYTAILAVNIVVLVTLESMFPLKNEWQMTLPSFKRDLKYLLAGATSIALINALFGLAAINLNGLHRGPISDWSLYWSVPVCLLSFEFLQYWQHRLSHELRGKVGGFLWRMHAAHHLPTQVYVFMHVAGHPINAFIVRGLVTLLPMYLLGVSAETALLVNTIIAIQGLISHCNLELRIGWFNYVFVGNELHRFHHSGDSDKSCNYGVATPVFDLLFGSFYYQPQAFPQRLGVHDPSLYPKSNQFWRVMRLPFAQLKQNHATQLVLSICLMALFTLSAPVIADENKLLATQSGSLHINAEEFKSSQGRAVARLYRSSDNVLGTPWRQQRADILNGQATFNFDNLSFSSYAVVVLHDLNDNGEVDHNFLRLPAEPLGFSNSFKLGLFSGKPTFEKLKFEFSANAGTIHIDMH